MQIDRQIFFISSARRRASSPANASSNDCKTGMPVYFSVRTERNLKDSARIVNRNLIYLSWETETEANTSYFELQRSENRKDFYAIEIVPAQGIPGIRTRYVTMDRKQIFQNDKLEYRLKVVSQDAKVRFTEAITLNLKTVANASAYGLTYNQQ